MLNWLQAKARLMRIRLAMRSALGNGVLHRWAQRAIQRRFDDRAAEWDRMVAEHSHKWFAPLDAALDTLPAHWKPSRILDIGGGTGRAGFRIVRRYPSAGIIVLDIARKMLQVGNHRKQTEQLPDVRFIAGDSTRLPISDGTIDLVYIMNAPASIAELERILRPGGAVIFAFTFGHHTPMYLDDATLKRWLANHSFRQITTGAGGEGTWLMAWKSGCVQGLAERG